MIRFKFRCSAFGVHYYDCFFRDAKGNSQSVEVCCAGFIESHPRLSYRYDVEITDPELLAAWRNFCSDKRAEYLDWLERNPACKPFSTLAPFREVAA